MKVYSQLESAQVENLSSDPTNLPEGRKWLNTTTGKIKTVVGGVAKSMVTEDQTQTITNKTIDGASNTLTNIPATTAIAGFLPKANGGSGQDNSGIAFPATGTLATRAGVEAITNKDIDGGTASNTSRITLPKAAKTVLDSLSRKQGTVVYDTTSNKPYFDNGTSLTPIGSGSGGSKNYITGGDAESGISGFLVSKNTTAAANPDNGFVSTATNITYVVSSTSPLADSNSFLLTKDAVSRLGEQVYVPFTIDSSAQAKVLQINFDYLVNSGTFTAGSSSDVTVWIYDVTNAVFIQPSSFNLQSNSTTIADKFQATFQTASNSTSYRLVFHVATTSTSAYSLKLDNIAVTPSVYVYGSPVADMQSFTPTFVGLGTATVVMANYSRRGDRHKYQVTVTSGTTTGSAVTMTLANGAVIDSNKLPSANYQNVGRWIFSSGSLNTGKGGPVIARGGDNTVSFSIDEYSVALNPFTPQVGNGIFGAGGTTISFEFEVPILGLSSSVQMSDQTDTRVVAVTRFDVSGATYGVGSKVAFATASFDTHGGWSSANSNYLITVPGYYKVNATLYSITGTQPSFQLYQNATSVRSFFGNGGTGGVAVLATTVFCNAGDTLDIRSTSSQQLSSAAGYNFLSIERASGPSTIAASESISASYWLSANFTSSPSTPINFDSKEFDSHGIVVPSGTAWKATIQTAGTYLISIAGLYYSSGSVTVFLWKNGSQYKNIASALNTMNGSGSILIKLLSGDYIDLRAGASSSISGGSLNGSNTANINIVKVGNY